MGGQDVYCSVIRPFLNCVVHWHFNGWLVVPNRDIGILFSSDRVVCLCCILLERFGVLSMTLRLDPVRSCGNNSLGHSSVLMVILVELIEILGLLNVEQRVQNNKMKPHRPFLLLPLQAMNDVFIQNDFHGFLC
jgi:hypothetical protein